MAHFAIINNEGRVDQVVKVNNEVLLDENGEEQESLGVAFLTSMYGEGNYKQTSINTWMGVHKLGGTPFRKNYAGYYFTYNEEIDGFIPPKLYESWILDTNKGIWIAPIEHPENKVCEWDEENQQWINCVDPIVPPNTPNEFLS